ANGHQEFPIQNLPIGAFSPPDGAPRGGVAIGDKILDLASASGAGIFSGEAAEAAAAASAPPLNAFLALDAGPRRALRAALSDLLAEGSAAQSRMEHMLRPAEDCRMRVPVRIGDYTDFYAGIHHATNVGRQFRPDNPLL